MDTIEERPVIDASIEVAVENEQHEYYAAGETIIQQGDSSRHACKLIAGEAKVFKSGDVIGTIRPGEIFGAIAALTSARRAASVIANGSCVVQRIERRKFLAMIKLDPGLLAKIK